MIKPYIKLTKLFTQIRWFGGLMICRSRPLDVKSGLRESLQMFRLHMIIVSTFVYIKINN